MSGLDFNTDFLQRQANPNELSAIVQTQGTRIAQVAQSFMRVNNLDEVAAAIGELQFIARDPSGQVRMIMSAINLLEEYGVNAHLAGFDTNGVPQIYMSADDGSLVAGGGDVKIGNYGIRILNDAENSILFGSTTDPNANNVIYVNSDDDFVYQNITAGPGHRFIIKLTNLATPYILWRENPALPNTALLDIGSGTNTTVVFGTDVTIDGSSEHRLEIGADHYIPNRNASNKTTIFNEANQDMDFNVQGDNDDNVFYVDASTDCVGIGTNAPGSKLDVAGSFQADSITNDTGLAAGTWTPTLTNSTNVAASVAGTWHYIRVGNQVYFHGVVQVDTTAVGAFLLYASLPIASNFNANDDANGSGTQPGTGVPNIISIREDQTNDRLQLDGYAQVNTNLFYRVVGGYIVK